MKDEFLKLCCILAELGLHYFFLFMDYASNFPNTDQQLYFL